MFANGEFAKTSKYIKDVSLELKSGGQMSSNFFAGMHPLSVVHHRERPAVEPMTPLQEKRWKEKFYKRRG